MQRTRVGVLRGGPSSEYEVSLKTGGAVLSALPAVYEPIDIFISKDGEWHYRGKSTTPEKALRQIDVAFNAMHGEFGEDGEVQRILDAFGVPYTGSGTLGSSLSIHKGRSKSIAQNIGLKVPRARVITVDDNAQEVGKELFQTFHPPYIVKPIALGSSVGVSMVSGMLPLIAAIAALQSAGVDMLVEERIKGKEATVGVIDHFRDKPQYALLPVEIRPNRGKDFFDYDAKYGGASEELCPGTFTKEESAELQRQARAIHDALHLRHYSRSDFIVTPRGIYYLESNSLPGLTPESLFPKSLAAVGSTMGEFLDHVIKATLTRKT
jgi:D-alanine-D-alanine ligase